MIKRVALPVASFLAIAFLISSCASSSEEQSSFSSRVAVPGEKLPDEGSVTPGAGGASSNIHF